jgi:multiple sugar transport system ATP-binding protein
VADVKLTGVGKSFGDARILQDVNLDIRDGEFMVFVGPSGCGKSTLLRTIAGLEDITSGELRIGGVWSMTCRRPNVALPWCSRVMRCTRT